MSSLRELADAADEARRLDIDAAAAKSAAWAALKSAESALAEAMIDQGATQVETSDGSARYRPTVERRARVDGSVSDEVVMATLEAIGAADLAEPRISVNASSLSARVRRWMDDAADRGESVDPDADLPGVIVSQWMSVSRRKVGGS